MYFCRHYETPNPTPSGIHCPDGQHDGLRTEQYPHPPLHLRRGQRGAGGLLHDRHKRRVAGAHLRGPGRRAAGPRGGEDKHRRVAAEPPAGAGAHHAAGGTRAWHPGGVQHGLSPLQPGQDPEPPEGGAAPRLRPRRHHGRRGLHAPAGQGHHLYQIRRGG